MWLRSGFVCEIDQVALQIEEQWNLGIFIFCLVKKIIDEQKSAVDLKEDKVLKIN